MKPVHKSEISVRFSHLTIGYSTIVRFFFFRGAPGASGIHIFSVISFIACTCSNRLAVGAIDNPGLLEQVFEQYDIPDVPEKNFRVRLFDSLSSQNVHF